MAVVAGTEVVVAGLVAAVQAVGIAVAEARVLPAVASVAAPQAAERVEGLRPSVVRGLAGQPAVRPRVSAEHSALFRPLAYQTLLARFLCSSGSYSRAI